MWKKAMLGKIAHNICNLDSKQAYVLLWILWLFMAPNICIVFVVLKETFLECNKNTLTNFMDSAEPI